MRLPVPALFGSPDSPYLRVDPPYMAASPGDTRAAAALADLCTALERALVEIVLAENEPPLVDNYRAVHGRKPFQAWDNFDSRPGWDNWYNIMGDGAGHGFSTSPSKFLALVAGRVPGDTVDSSGPR